MQNIKFNNRWRRRRMLFSQHVPHDVSHWLFDSGSLTKRLIQRYPQTFNVKVIRQSIKSPTLDERRALGISSSKSALIREVLLCSDNRPLVYARTVIPLSSLTGAQRCYASLGDRPLGAMLFADRSMTRDEVEVSSLKSENPLYVNTGCSNETVWGRRSIFRVSKKPILVSEFFLPGV